MNNIMVNFQVGHMTQNHNHIQYIAYSESCTYIEISAGPTYSAVNVRVAGWVDGEVWVEVMVADRKRRGGLWASEWKWDGVAAPGLGTSRTEAACKAASTDSRHKDKLHLKYHRLTVFTHEASEMGMSIDKCATSVCGMLARPHPFLGLKKSTLPLIRPPCFHKFPWQG